MSLICPSSSHQLAAAATAFQRARRKFPKNLGLRSSSRESFKDFKANTLSAGPTSKTTGRGLSAALSPVDNNVKLNCLWSSWSNDSRQNKFSKEIASTRPETACSYCQHCHEQVCNVTDLSKRQFNDGDDVESLIAETTTRAESKRTHDEDRYEITSRTTHNSRFKAEQCNRQRPCVHGRYCNRSSKNEDSVDRFVEVNDDNVIMTNDLQNNHGHRLDTVETADFPKKLREWERRTRQKLPTKLEGTSLRRGTTPPSKICTRIHSSNLVSPRFTHPIHGHRHRHHQCHRHRNCKQLSPVNQDRHSKAEVCLRPSIVRAQQRNIRNEGESTGLISTLPEEHGDDMIVINHKNSMELLAKKFNMNSKNRNATMTNKSKLDESQLFSSEIVDPSEVDDATVRTLDDVSRRRVITVNSLVKPENRR